MAQVAKGPVESLDALAGNQTPFPIPETAVDIDFDGAEGKLEFNSASNIKAVVAFYRSAMKPLGWKEQPSVINTAYMVELDFSKGAKGISLTIMRTGDAGECYREWLRPESRRAAPSASPRDRTKAHARVGASIPGGFRG